MQDTKRPLSAIEYGDGQAADQLLPLIYDELHRLAAKSWPGSGRGKPSKPRTWSTRPISASWSRRRPSTGTVGAHFFAAAAEAMRRILVEHARRRRARKYGGGWHRIPLDDVQVADRQHDGNQADVILAIDEALERFAAEDPVKAELVKLRYFAGLSVKEAASVLGISRITAKRYWSYGAIHFFRLTRRSLL